MRRRSCPWLLVGLLLVACEGEPTPVNQPEAVAKPESTPEAAPAPEPEVRQPSNTPTQQWTQQWATPTDQPTASVVAVRDGRVYAIGGAFVDIDTPATHVVAFAEDTGKVLWTYAGKVTLSLVGISEALLELQTIEEKRITISAKTGKVVKPKKAESDALVPIPEVGAEACEANGVELRCGDWSVTEAGTISKLVKVDDRVCFAVAEVREVRCRVADTGDLELAVPVPAVKDVKEPAEVNFNFHLVGSRLIVGNYDGTVLAFAAAGQ
jgi:outer membrane protein assembly factor BamB